jgi:hypothetical protein
LVSLEELEHVSTETTTTWMLPFYTAYFKTEADPNHDLYWGMYTMLALVWITFGTSLPIVDFQLDTSLKTQLASQDHIHPVWHTILCKPLFCTMMLYTCKTFEWKAPMSLMSAVVIDHIQKNPDDDLGAELAVAIGCETYTRQLMTDTLAAYWDFDRHRPRAVEQSSSRAISSSTG